MDAPEQNLGPEKRLIHRVLHAWREACGANDFPPPKAMGAKVLGADDWAWCAVLVLADHGAEPRFAHVGAAHADLAAPDDPVAIAPKRSVLGQGVSYWAQAAARRVPISLGETFMDDHGRTVLHRSALLPLSADGLTVTHLLCAANGRIEPAEQA